MKLHVVDLSGEEGAKVVVEVPAVPRVGEMVVMALKGETSKREYRVHAVSWHEPEPDLDPRRLDCFVVLMRVL